MIEEKNIYDVAFEKWLENIHTKYIDAFGIETLREIFNAMDDEDKL